MGAVGGNGGAGTVRDPRDRAKHQSGVTANTVSKIALTGAIVVLGAQQGEQQRPGQILS